VSLSGMHMRMQVPAEASDLLEMESRAVVSCLMWVLRTKSSLLLAPGPLCSSDRVSHHSPPPDSIFRLPVWVTPLLHLTSTSIISPQFLVAFALSCCHLLRFFFFFFFFRKANYLTSTFAFRSEFWNGSGIVRLQPEGVL
jgi:hypothetical protein